MGSIITLTFASTDEIHYIVQILNLNFFHFLSILMGSIILSRFSSEKGLVLYLGAISILMIGSIFILADN